MERSMADHTGLCGNDEQNNKQLTKKAGAQGLIRPDWKAAPENHEPLLWQVAKAWKLEDLAVKWLDGRGGGVCDMTARVREMDRKEKEKRSRRRKGGERDEAGHRESSDDGSDQRATCQTLEVISCSIEDFYGILAA